MTTVHIPFPDDLRSRAEEIARERGLSLDEFVRQCVRSSVDGNRASDPLFSDNAVFKGDAPSDLAENHDAYLDEGQP